MTPQVLALKHLRDQCLEPSVIGGPTDPADPPRGRSGLDRDQVPQVLRIWGDLILQSAVPCHVYITTSSNNNNNNNNNNNYNNYYYYYYYYYY